MSRNHFVRALSLLLIVAIVAPSAFLIAPQRASASAVSCIGGLLGIVGAAGAAATVVSVPVTDTVTQIGTGSTAGSTGASCINDMILIPLARAAIRAILQKMTASVVNWINGKSNGTGQPSYPTDLRAMLQNVGDAVAIPFINQISAGLMSPFGPAISSALKTNYTQQTTLGGFFAANRCTLSSSSRNILAFLHGNWSQGGAAAWFALTTQTQNNPYTLYQNSLAQIANTVGAGAGGAVGARLADLGWGSGFMSWCGAGDASTQTQNSAVTQYQQCQANGGTGADCQKAFDSAGGKMSSGGAIKVGDPCVDSKGVPGKMQTPGSVIHDYTQKAVVASGFDQLISANDLDAALSQIINALLGRILGTVGGLFGASQPSGSTSSITNQLNNYQASSTNATNTASQTAQDISTRVTAYKTAWDTITNSANAAKANLTSLQNLCTTNAATASTTEPIFIATATAEAAVAQDALTNKVTPIITLAQTASGIAATAQALALKIQTESQSTSGSATLTSDLSTLIGMPPTLADIANAQTNASATGGSNASPTGSLTVSGGTLVDQMNLISTNAIALKTSVCTFSSASGPSPVEM